MLCYWLSVIQVCYVTGNSDKNQASAELALTHCMMPSAHSLRVDRQYDCQVRSATKLRRRLVTTGLTCSDCGRLVLLRELSLLLGLYLEITANDLAIRHLHKYLLTVVYVWWLIFF